MLGCWVISMDSIWVLLLAGILVVLKWRTNCDGVSGGGMRRKCCFLVCDEEDQVESVLCTCCCLRRKEKIAEKGNLLGMIRSVYLKLERLKIE